METRKTNKYYREMLCKDIISARSVIVEVLKKYGKDKYRTYIPAKSNNEFWNCMIDGIGLTDDGKPYLSIYWQGDSTDGNADIWLSDLYNRNECVIGAECRDGYILHDRLRVNVDWLPSVYKAVAEYIKPKNVKARKEYEEKSKALWVLRPDIKPYFKDNYGGGFGNEKYNKAINAVDDFIVENWKELLNKDHNSRLEMTKPIFSANYR